jgi:hypothetical protein
MAYYLKAWIAREDVFESLDIPARPLKHGFAISTTDCLKFSAQHRHDMLYVHADYFGGIGAQSSVLYQCNGAVTFFTEENCSLKSPISQGLAWLGVDTSDSDSDEFDALNLSAVRNNLWLEEKQ